MTFTNLAKNAISPTTTAKGYARQAVYGIGVYGIAIYGVGTPNFGVVANQSKSASTFTNVTKN